MLGLEAQLAGLHAGVVLDDPGLLAGLAHDLALVDHVVGALLGVLQNGAGLVLGVQHPLLGVLAGALQRRVHAHLGGADAVHGLGLGLAHDALALGIHLQAVLHRVRQVLFHIVDNHQAFFRIDDLFAGQRHVGARLNRLADVLEQLQEVTHIVDFFALLLLLRGFAGIQLFILVELILIAIHALALPFRTKPPPDAA